MSNLKSQLRKLFDDRDYRRPADLGLMIALGLLSLFGLLALASATPLVSYSKFADPNRFFKEQLAFFIVGLIVFYLASRIDYHYYRAHSLGFLIFTIVLLCLVFIPGLGYEANSSRSWLNLFGLSIQPTELVKLSFLLYLASWLEGRRDQLKDLLQGTRPFFLLMGLIALLIMLQPDFGSLFIITASSVAVYYVGGGNVKHLLVIGMIGLLAVAMMISVRSYQQVRLKCFFDSENYRDEQGRDLCFQTNQSLIAVGSGAWIGRGVGGSRQKYFYLPEVASDSIFAVIAEDGGLIISAALVLLYLYIFYRLWSIAGSAPDVFGQNLAIGIAVWFFVQAFLNIGGIINLVPMTGVPLPLISKGGSSLVALLCALGVVLNISRHAPVSLNHSRSRSVWGK